MATSFTESKLQSARLHAANSIRETASHVLDDDYGFAEHVTMQEKIKVQNDYLQWANEIEQGLHDNNFTVKQTMFFYLTGKTLPFFPEYEN
jgi:hypothetical protein